MQDSLLRYYERELTYFRKMGQEFAQEHPKVAGRLGLEAGKCDDPHVERLIQGFAFLAGRIHHKLDDTFPEITDALLQVLYPHFLAPLPSCSIAQFVPDPSQGKLTDGYTIDQGTILYSRPVGGNQCRFQTCYPTTLWPIEVRAARIEPPDAAPRGVKARATLRLTLGCLGGVSFHELPLSRLRFYLHGEHHSVYRLYELLLNNQVLVSHECGVIVQSGAGASTKRLPIELSPDCLQPVGFQKEEGLFPYPPHAFLGYRLLQEYFTFPQKFLFLELQELERVNQAGFGDEIDVLVFLDRLPQLEPGISANNFQLGCCPIVNVFPQIAEPIRIDHTQFEYRVVPDSRRQGALEVYSINEVTCISPNREAVASVQPLYSATHSQSEEGASVFWYAQRKPSHKKGDAGTEVYLSLVDLSLNTALPPADTLTLHLHCTNRDLPGRLPPMSQEGGYFELEGAPPLARIRYLVKPTKTVRPTLGGANRWKLISHLSLNYLSIADGSPEPLQEILRLYDYMDTPALRQQIAGLIQLSNRQVVRRLPSMEWNSFCRGLEVTAIFDEEKYTGSGVFLFASVLERFMGMYASLNSFVEFVAKTSRREEPLRRWPPRAGDQILV